MNTYEITAGDTFAEMEADRIELQSNGYVLFYVKSDVVAIAPPNSLVTKK